METTVAAPVAAAADDAASITAAIADNVIPDLDVASGLDTVLSAVRFLLSPNHIYFHSAGNKS